MSNGNNNNRLNLLETDETLSSREAQRRVPRTHAVRGSDLTQNILETDEAFRMLKDIEQNPEITQRHLAAKHDISLGKTNYILNALIEKGIIKAQNFKNSKNKAAYMYVLTPEGIRMRAELARNFIQRKIQEYEKLRGEIEAFNKDINETVSVELAGKDN